MSARAAIFASIRRSLGVSGREPLRASAVTERLRNHPVGVIPERGKLAPAAQVELFRKMVEAAAGTVESVAGGADVPRAVFDFLRSHNLPMAIRHGEDARLMAMPWNQQPLAEVRIGPSVGNDLTAVSHAIAGVAESGTLMLISGRHNPTTLNFLPDTHIVVLKANDVVGDYESLWGRLRQHFGGGAMPRTINLITGPSRSADIEQTLILGAHGPRRLHVIIVGQGAS
jgi:L-lactate dehydrogenase complex protein LldG